MIVDPTAGESGWQKDSRLEALTGRVAAGAFRRFPHLRKSDLALTLLLVDRSTASGASFRGGAAFYPASIVKLFYLVAVMAWLEKGELSWSEELAEALAAMIGHSSNDATHHIVDLLTGATAGPALAPRPLRGWLARRQSVNRYFKSWHCPEFAGINLTQKTWAESPYGRERQSLAARANGRNSLSTDAVARLLLAIARGKAVGKARSKFMMKLMARGIQSDKRAEPFDQIHGFLGEGLPKGARLWSKGGWTSRVKHDAAIIDLPAGRRIVLVVFTAAGDEVQARKLLPFVARRVTSGLAATFRSTSDLPSD